MFDKLSLQTRKRILFFSVFSIALVILIVYFIVLPKPEKASKDNVGESLINAREEFGKVMSDSKRNFEELMGNVADDLPDFPTSTDEFFDEEATTTTNVSDDFDIEKMKEELNRRLMEKQSEASTTPTTTNYTSTTTNNYAEEENNKED